MNERVQTIKLYIAGDDSKNIKIVELSNWTGKAYVGERKHSKIIQKTLIELKKILNLPDQNCHCRKLII